MYFLKLRKKIINISGTQMYMITKQYAKTILDKLDDTSEDFYKKYFTIEKLLHGGNKSLLYSMLAIENGEQEDQYHELCHNIHFDESFT